MKHFIIQTGNNGQVLHDFSFRLIEAIGFAEWKYGYPMYGHQFSAEGEGLVTLTQKGVSVEDIVPIGSLEFVFDRMTEMGVKGVSNVTPLNIPDFLQQPEFLNRSYESGLTRQALLVSDMELPKFIKSATVYKGFVDVVEDKRLIRGLSPVERFDVSEVVDIEAEWRVFVQRDEMVGAKPYGSHHLFPKPPNVRFLERLIQAIKSERQAGGFFPMSYTLDIGVSLDGSFLIECHPFVSCGLYGFEDLERLPSMMIQGFSFFKAQANSNA